MKRLSKVPALAFALGALTVGAIFAGQAAWAALTSHAADEQVNACVKTQNGQVRIVAAGEECLASEQALSWSIEGPQGDTGPQGPQGPAGGAANLTSPNGDFSVEITDRGVFVRGPGGTLYVDRFGVGDSPSPNFGE